MSEADRLSSELRAPLPLTFHALPSEQLAFLTEALVAEKRRQVAELDAAVQRGLRFLPRVLRVAVRKALVG